MLSAPHLGSTSPSVGLLVPGAVESRREQKMGVRSFPAGAGGRVYGVEYDIMKGTIPNLSPFSLLGCPRKLVNG